MYAYRCICIHIYIQTYIHIFILFVDIYVYVYVYIHTNITCMRHKCMYMYIQITCMYTHLCTRLCCLLPLLLCEGVTAGDLNDGILCHPCGFIMTFPPGVRGRLPTVVGLLSSSVGAMALLVPGRLLASSCVCCSVCVAV